MHGTASHDLIWCLDHRAGGHGDACVWACAADLVVRAALHLPPRTVVSVRYKLCTYNAHYSSIYAVVTVIGIGAEAVQHP